jgi:hypothetical protein
MGKSIPDGPLAGTTGIALPPRESCATGTLVEGGPATLIMTFIQ